MSVLTDTHNINFEVCHRVLSQSVYDLLSLTQAMLNMSTLSTNDQGKSFWELVYGSINQVLADHRPAISYDVVHFRHHRVSGYRRRMHHCGKQSTFQRSSWPYQTAGQYRLGGLDNLGGRRNRHLLLNTVSSQQTAGGLGWSSHVLSRRRLVPRSSHAVAIAKRRTHRA